MCGLTMKELDVFTRWVVLLDLRFEVEQGHDLPGGLNPDEIESELARIEAVLPKKLRDRADIRKASSDAIAQELVRSGILNSEDVKNPNYFRHVVLEYARAEAIHAQTPGHRLKSPRWARRFGSKKDTNTNFLEAEFE